jgi:DNA-binding response OmpR family regulator
VDSGVDRQQQGTGLGLTLTRRFARLHGGEVRVDSRPGSGSVFTIHMPLKAVPQAQKIESHTLEIASANGDAQAPLVLIVEDDPPASELLARQLQRAGFRTAIVRDGKDVLSKAKQLQPAAITLDILLPGLDGWEVLTRLKHDETTSSIPVIVISVVDNPDLGIALGAVDYFVKPVPAKELISRLRRFNITNGARPKTQILVVDDERANREWLTEILEPAGFGVIPAIGGREAIELALSRNPDLVLLDLMMPDVSGFDVVEALRSERATSKTPIMVLTAKDLTEADKRQLNGRVSSILQRGSTGAADLIGLLRQVVDPGAVGV